jgi:hypothetical protein
MESSYMDNHNYMDNQNKENRPNGVVLDTWPMSLLMCTEEMPARIQGHVKPRLVFMR